MPNPEGSVSSGGNHVNADVFIKDEMQRQTKFVEDFHQGLVEIVASEDDEAIGQFLLTAADEMLEEAKQRESSVIHKTTFEPPGNSDEQ